MPPIEVTTVGAALLSCGMFATTLAWKLIPPRNSSTRDWATGMALLALEIKHLRADVQELKEELAKLR